MRNIKTISSIIILVAIFYIVCGISAMLARNIHINILGAKALGIDPELWRTNMLINGLILLSIGSLAMIASIGIFKAKDWARQLWLGVSVIMLISEIIFVLHQENDMGETIESLIVLLIVLFSWWYFRKETIKALFQRAT
jgi:hypothetical protein